MSREFDMTDYTDMTLEQLARAGGQPGSQAGAMVEREFLRRQTKTLQDAADYQKLKADEETKISKEMKRQSKYMLWTVIAIAVAAIIQAGAAIFAAYHMS